MPQAIDRSRGWLTPTSVRSGKMVCQRLCTKLEVFETVTWSMTLFTMRSSWPKWP